MVQGIEWAILKKGMYIESIYKNELTKGMNRV